MAISIDNVYKTTLTLLNKEQRGYVTSTEFNEIAGIVQNEVFEGYFQKAGAPDNMDSELANIGEQYKEKLQPFITTHRLTPTIGATYSPIEIDNLYRTLDFYPIYDLSAIPIKADRMNTMTANKVMLSPLTSPTRYNPIVVVQSEAPGLFNPSNTYMGYQVNPAPTFVDLEYIRRPNTPNWRGTTVDGQLVPNITDPFYQDFELHESDYAEVVARTLSYFGLQTRSDEVIGVAGQKEAQNNAI